MNGSKQVERQVQGAHRVGEGTGRDGVHSSGGYVMNGIERDAATSFQPKATSIEGYRLAELGEVHVVQQDEVDAGEGQEIGQLLESGRFELDAHAQVIRPHAIDGLLQGFQVASGCQVIVFDHDGVVEPEAMIDAAAGEHGLFFDQAPARRGFARVPDFDGIRLHRLYVAGGHGGDTGEALEEVQCGALGGEDGAGATFDLDQGIASLEGLAIGEQRPDAKAGIDFTKHRFGDGHASDDAWFAGNDPALVVGAVVDEVKRGDITAADVFGDGGLDESKGGWMHGERGLIARLRGNSSAEVSG